MRKLLMTLSAAVCLLTPATVAFADLSYQDCCPTAYTPCCEEYFSGFYVGGNVGGISYTAHTTDRDEFFIDGASYTSNDINIVAGVQIGYDWQCCNRVFGIVADWDWSNADATTHIFSAAPGIDLAIRRQLDWFSTIRLRGGLAVNDVLVYITGGAVAGHHKDQLRNIFTGSDFDQTFKKTRWGWAFGAGTEFAFGRNWSLNAEILFLGFNQRSESAHLATTPITFNFDFNHSAWIGRVGINYRFTDLCCW